MSEQEQEELRYVLLTEVDVNPYQPRRLFNEEEIAELGLSIQMVGLIHPPVVRQTVSGRYELVSGERRFRAAKWAGLQEIPVLVRQHNTLHSAKAALIENIQRVDLNPIEVAYALRKLIDEFGYSQEEVSRQIGKKRSTVANYLRLLTLPKSIQESVMKGELTMGHAKVILSVDTLDGQLALYDNMIKNHLTVRQAEEVAAKQTAKNLKDSFKIASRKDPNIEQIELELQRKLGTKVSVQNKGNNGSIAIEYYNLDDLDRILSLFNIVL